LDNCLKLSLLNTKATVEFLLRNVTSVSQRQMMKKIPAAGTCRADATNDAQIYRLNNHCQPLAESVTTNNPVLTHARATYVSNSPNWPPLMTVSTDRPTDRPNSQPMADLHLRSSNALARCRRCCQNAVQRYTRPYASTVRA